MNKTTIRVLFSVLLVCLLASCAKPADQSASSKSVSSSSAVFSHADPTAGFNKGKDQKSITNLTWVNPINKDGDADGPAFVVYSKTGYNMSSFDLKLSQVKTNLIRKSDKKAIAAYLFLGADVHQNDQWVNCTDAGLCKVGNQKWHLCMNRYQPEGAKWYDDYPWWESNVSLDETHDYRLTLSTQKADETLTLSIYDLTAGVKLADTHTVKLKYAKKDGSNISFYRDEAIDFPDEVCKDVKGNATKDWPKVMAYNFNENIYLKNIRMSNVKLYKGDACQPWAQENTDCRFLWPDSSVAAVSYPCTNLSVVTRDSEDILNLDMNANTK